MELPNVPYGLKGGMAINFFMRAAPTIVSDFPVSYIYSHTRGPFNVNASSQVQVMTISLHKSLDELLNVASLLEYNILLA